jgi:hypothetical protein
MSQGTMLIVHVYVRVKPESVEAFKQASLDNARQSVQEPGIARFDLIQQSDDPTRFRARRGVSHRGRSGGAQRNETLSNVARYRGAHDG